MFYILIFLSLFLQASTYPTNSTVTPDLLSRLGDIEKYNIFSELKKQSCGQERQSENSPYEGIVQRPKFKTLDSIQDQILESISKTQKNVRKMKMELLDPVEKMKPAFYPILAFFLWFTKIINYLDEMMTVGSIKEVLENGMKEEFA